ncbi:TlpA family protein disulfide reductase [Sphingobacterium luzhongxinii]|uniref:TlpA family protein disulfide reductase n=1 Tax=Sphingobacterium luzhongxinii TaxID=2654181 RepID=UPI0013DA4FC6|nr:TlpA disulfide reductase family protein [Sphingobacterium sp. xlx-73]
MKALRIVTIVFSILFLLKTTQAGHDPQMAMIQGKVSDFDFKIDKITLYQVYNGSLKEHSTTVLNKNREFGFNVPIAESGFYFIDYGQFNNRLRGQNIRLYLEPEISLDLTINENDYTLGGKNLGHNTLVHQANEINNKFRAYNRLDARKTYVDFFPFLENQGIKMVDQFKKSINTKDNTFNDLLRLAVQADFENEAYFFFRLPRTAHPDKFDRPTLYSQLKAEEIKFNEPNILKLDNGISWMRSYFSYYRGRDGATVNNVDIIANDTKQISDIKLKEVYSLAVLKELKLKPEQYKVVIQPLYSYLTSDESKTYILEYEKQMHKDKGQPGFEFSYPDINGKTVSFSDFKGKFLYIDVWATWCGPCKKEIPHLQELEHDYKDKDIVFMSISVDKMKDQQKWKDFVKSQQLGGVQLMADKDFSSGIVKNYDITGIPRFLLFDKEGKIITANADRPSNSMLRIQLDRLLSGSN